MLGTKALEIFDETTCVVRAVRRWTEFYTHESCGKCTPCREGTFWLARSTTAWKPVTGTAEDLDKLLDISDDDSRKVVLRLGRRCGQPGHVVDPSTSATNTSRTSRAAAARSIRTLSMLAGARASMTARRNGLRCAGRRRTNGAPNQPPDRLVNADHRRHRNQRAQGNFGDPRGRVDRHPDPPVLRPPAARPGRRVPPVPRRGRGPAQTDGVVHDHGHRRHGGHARSTPRRPPTRRSTA